MVNAFNARLTTAPVATTRPTSAAGGSLGDSLLRRSREHTLRELSEQARLADEEDGGWEAEAGVHPDGDGKDVEGGPFGDEFYAETKLRELTSLLQDIRVQHKSSQEFLRERIESQDRTIEGLSKELGESRAELAQLRREFSDSEMRSSSIISRLQTSMQTIIEATSHLSVQGGAAVDLSALADLQRQQARAEGEEYFHVADAAEAENVGAPSTNPPPVPTAKSAAEQRGGNGGRPLIVPVSQITDKYEGHIEVPSYAKMRANERSLEGLAPIPMAGAEAHTVHVAKHKPPTDAFHPYRKSFDGPILHRMPGGLQHAGARSSYDAGSLSLRHAVGGSL